jgi:beta-lactam-binding protein with PASTA domain/predicted Ser/Thr protein kinase
VQQAGTLSNSAEPTVINDRYEIHKRVGRGGMADVFLARDLLLDRQVAIKVLFPEFAVDPNFVERFRREAQAAANLSHPNIVNVYDWGKYSGTYFIAMEYVQGRTLAEILRSNRHLTAKQSAEIASEVAAALGFAHEAGLAHRDIKPANILIGSNGQVKVADFGIARAMNAATEANLTQAGAVMGTASYFSPEQAQGAQPDPRSDLYSLGIVMYEMVAGRPPFTGDNPVAIAYKQVHDQPQPLNQIVADVPRAFEAIIAKLLAKDPKLRYPSAHALRDDLRRFRNGEQVQALVAAAAGATAATATQVQRPPAPGTATGAFAAAGATTTMRTTPSPPMPSYPPGASPDARYYEDGPSRTGWYALAAFIALLALVAGGVLLFQALSGDGDEASALTLDDYTGMSLEAATAALNAIGLPYESFPEPNAAVPEDFVHRTDPTAGTVVTDDTIIKLYYNPSPELKAVPDVSNMALVDAQATLAAAGFQFQLGTPENNADVGEGLVIRTDPPAGEQVRQDTVVTIIPSGGPQQVAIPGIVIGDAEADARALLESDQYGLVVQTQQQENDSPAGTVIGVNPEPNTLVARGSTVTLIVSSGPGQVTVPPLRGVTEGQARNQLAAQELGVNVTYQELSPGDPNDGRVISQDVPGGSQVDRGTVVNLVVGRATAPATTTSTSTTTTTTTTTTVPATTPST